MNDTIDLKQLMDEYESLKNRAYNLNLYLDYIEKNYPAVFAQLNEHFEGLPGYCNMPNLEGLEYKNE